MNEDYDENSQPIPDTTNGQTGHSGPVGISGDSPVLDSYSGPFTRPISVVELATETQKVRDVITYLNGINPHRDDPTVLETVDLAELEETSDTIESYISNRFNRGSATYTGTLSVPNGGTALLGNEILTIRNGVPVWETMDRTRDPQEIKSKGNSPDWDEIAIKEKAIEATCQAFGAREVSMEEFADLLDKFYNYLKFGTRLS
jgi:hypothetical protein